MDEMDAYRALAEAIFDAGKDILATSLTDLMHEEPDAFFIFAGYYLDGDPLFSDPVLGEGGATTMSEGSTVDDGRCDAAPAWCPLCERNVDADTFVRHQQDHEAGGGPHDRIGD